MGVRYGICVTYKSTEGEYQFIKGYSWMRGMTGDGIETCRKVRNARRPMDEAEAYLLNQTYGDGDPTETFEDFEEFYRTAIAKIREWAEAEEDDNAEILIEEGHWMADDNPHFILCYDCDIPVGMENQLYDDVFLCKPCFARFARM